MKQFLEDLITWNAIRPANKEKPAYMIKKAELNQADKCLNLDLAFNFELPAEDITKIEKVLQHRVFNYVRRVRLKASLLTEETEGAWIILEPKPQPATERSQANAAEKNAAGRRRAGGRSIMGKKIAEEARPIAELAAGQESAVIQGTVFKVNSRVIRKGNLLVSLLINDDSGSTCVKWFTSDERFAADSERLQPGCAIKVRGIPEYDTYEKAVTLSAREIQETRLLPRMDSASQKRVELHAHTKMSAMDGLADVAELIDRASIWGHPAIALTDHGVVQSFPEAANAAKRVAAAGRPVKLIYGLEGYLIRDASNYKTQPVYHIILLAQNQTGLHNLYKLVSLSHLNYFYKRPRLPAKLIEQHREGLIIGSACQAGEVYQALLAPHSREADVDDIARFYDYLEIQPVSNNLFLVDEGRVTDIAALETLNRQVVELGDRLGLPVVATGDVHYIDEADALYRQILMAGQGYKDVESNSGLYYRTTTEMLDEFAYLGEERARQVVIENPRRIADRIEEVSPIAKGNFPPEIPDADKILRETCLENAHRLYGESLPEPVADRLERELSLIIDNDYAVLYVSAGMLVQESLRNGYLVGSRGSVGSSLAATMFGITEVNPLPPHYICSDPACRNTVFADLADCDCGVDLPDAQCPRCGADCLKEGFNIPFEVFLGFSGDVKTPDIDLNFAGEYQSQAHKFLETIFGRENIYRVGTIGTIAEKTAFGFVKKYFEEKGLEAGRWEIERLASQCTGVRRTTGQHPGGVIIVPRDHDITEFCPVQHPANNEDKGVITTHFDYHSIEENLLKLDILGHDVPSMLRMLEDSTGVAPLLISLNDEKTNSLFRGIESLGIDSENYRYRHGTLGVPEFGTAFVRQMLDDIQPHKFADLIRICGLSHGTDVWIGNAQELIRSGTTSISGVISTRDDIMNDLIARGLPQVDSFHIMEGVRKGRGLTAEHEKLMRDHEVPEWYIESCKSIKYMFPKAHAVAYVMMSYRIAYYKVHYPLAFYAAFFTVKIADFNASVILGGTSAVLRRMLDIEQQGRAASAKELDELVVLEVAYEMLERGLAFHPVDLKKSTAGKFEVEEGRIRLPLAALAGVGVSAAAGIVAAREEHDFLSVSDLTRRARLNKTAIQALREAGALADLSETNQLCWFN
jgi:DNA polymerase-3 subunit alpha (Gram-positive type)